MIQKGSLRENAFDLSSEVQQRAKEEKLGELRKVYPVSKRSTPLWFIGQICIGWGVVILGITALMIVAIFFLPSPPSLISILGVAAFGFLLLILGCYMSFKRGIYARWQLTLWQYGFVYKRSRVIQVFRWDQIENVHRVSEGATQHTLVCKVRRWDGYEVKLDVFADLAELVDIVLEEFACQLAPKELNIISSKNIRVFTDLKLDRQGINNGREKLSWQEMQGFAAKNGVITIYVKRE